MRHSNEWRAAVALTVMLVLGVLTIAVVCEGLIADAAVNAARAGHDPDIAFIWFVRLGWIFAALYGGWISIDIWQSARDIERIKRLTQPNNERRNEP